MENRFYNVKDVEKILEVKKAKAYNVIRDLNSELEEKGFLTVAGRIPRTYFDKRFCIGGLDGKEN